MNEPLESISLLPYCHADWAWGHHREWHVHRYVRSFEIALDLLDRHPEFTWTIDTYTDQLRPVLEHRPDLIQRMKPHVASGRLSIAGGLYANPHPDRTGREAYLRNAIYGRRLFLELFPGAELSALSHEDVIAGHAQLPQVLAGLGYLYYTSSRSLPAMLARGIPRQFKWEGLDGTTIIAEISHYGGLGPELVRSDFRERWEEARKPFVEWAQARRAEGASPVLMCLQGAGDDSLPLRAALDEPGPYLEFVEEWRRREKISLEFSTLPRHARRLLARSDFPVRRGTLDPVGWSYWYAQNGRASLWRLRLEAETLLCQLERALMHHSAGAYPRAALEGLWLRALSVWSHATLWLWDRDYEEFLTTIRGVLQEGRRLLEGLRHGVAARAVGATERSRGLPLVVFNPLPWAREETVTFRFSFDEMVARGASIVDSSGVAAPTQVSPDCYYQVSNGTMREALVHARLRVPASGHAVYSLRPSPEPENVPERFRHRASEIRSSRLLVAIEGGRPERVELLDLGRTLCGAVELCFEEIDEGGNYPTLNRRDYFGPSEARAPVEPWSIFHYGKLVGRSIYRARDWSLAEAGPVAWRLTSVGEVAGNEADWEILVRDDSSRMDVALTVYVSEPRSGFFLASVAPAFAGTVHCDIPWGVEERRQESEPFGMQILERRDFPAFWAHSWADYSDGRAGVAILSQEGQQGFRMRDGRLEHFLLKTIAPEQLRGRRWSNAYRTGLGRQEFRFALHFHTGDWRAARLYREVEAYRQPLAPLQPLERSEGAGQPRFAGLELSPANVMLSGIYREGEATILRIYENEGAASTAEVALPFVASSAHRTDLLGRPEREPRVDLAPGGRRLRVPLRGWEIATVELR